MNNPSTLIALVIQKLSLTSSNSDLNNFIEEQHLDKSSKLIDPIKFENKRKNLGIKDKINMVRHKDLRARLYLSEEELNALNFNKES